MGDSNTAGGAGGMDDLTESYPAQLSVLLGGEDWDVVGLEFTEAGGAAPSLAAPPSLGVAATAAGVRRSSCSSASIST